MSSEDFVNQLQQGNNLGAEDAFKSAMQDKVADALENKRREGLGLKTFVNYEDLSANNKKDENINNDIVYISIILINRIKLFNFFR